MKKLKTLVVAILCFVFIFALCACQDPAGSGGNGGTNQTPAEPQQPIKDVQIDEQILQISAEKLAHIDNLASQKVDAQGWQDAISTYNGAKNVSINEILKRNDQITNQTFKYALVNGKQHASVQRIDGQKSEICFEVYEDDKYFSYQRTKIIADGSTTGWLKSEEKTLNINMFSTVKILQRPSSYLNTWFNYDDVKKCYVAETVNTNGEILATFRVKFEDGKIVYMEQKLDNGTTYATYFCDYGTTTVEVPTEVKKLF